MFDDHMEPDQLNDFQIVFSLGQLVANVSDNITVGDRIRLFICSSPL